MKGHAHPNSTHSFLLPSPTSISCGLGRSSMSWGGHPTVCFAGGGDQLFQFHGDWGVNGEQLRHGMPLGARLLVATCGSLQHL